uniref:Uncharacterized protein n=1 Tax=Bursaphelenchus xylophilus TaxID=6326 RepID=A0A1I7SC28_BURXY
MFLAGDGEESERVRDHHKKEVVPCLRDRREEREELALADIPPPSTGNVSHCSRPTIAINHCQIPPSSKFDPVFGDLRHGNVVIAGIQSHGVSLKGVRTGVCDEFSDTAMGFPMVRRSHVVIAYCCCYCRRRRTY